MDKEGTPMRPLPLLQPCQRTGENSHPLAGNIPHSVKNSSAFVEGVSVMELEAQDCLVSFDVTNLFTQVPVDEALKVLEERLSADDTLMERTSIPVSQLTELIEICLRTTFFQFQDTFCEQLDGAATGPPPPPPPFTCCHKPLYGAPRGDCPADCP